VRRLRSIRLSQCGKQVTADDPSIKPQPPPTSSPGAERLEGWVRGMDSRPSKRRSVLCPRHPHLARESGSLLEASEVANVVMFMLTRPRGMTIRDVVMLPTNFDL
jgi:hypothetical protein